MGFEDFNILLVSGAPDGVTSNDTCSTAILAHEIRGRWPLVGVDHVEVALTQVPLRQSDHLLAYESTVGLFQVLLSEATNRNGTLLVSMRFAYCNPSTVFDPFCSMAEWLMLRYGMVCYNMRRLEDDPEDPIRDAEQIRRILAPSMDHYKRLWHIDVEDDREAIVRPGDAMALFVVPLLKRQGESDGP